VGAGQHQKVSSPAGTYAFARTWKGAGVDDGVVIALTPTP
jgi:hypothetical protein